MEASHQYHFDFCGHVCFLSSKMQFASQGGIGRSALSGMCRMLTAQCNISRTAGSCSDGGALETAGIVDALKIGNGGILRFARGVDAGPWAGNVAQTGAHTVRLWHAAGPPCWPHVCGPVCTGAHTMQGCCEFVSRGASLASDRPAGRCRLGLSACHLSRNPAVVLKACPCVHPMASPP